MRATTNTTTVQLVKNGDLAGGIEAYVKQHDWVTFAEIQSVFRDVTEVFGDHALFHTPYENLVIWTGMSESLVSAVRQLMTEKSIFMQSTTALVYLIDGVSVTLPVAKSFRSYKTLRWSPMCLRPYDKVDARAK